MSRQRLKGNVEILDEDMNNAVWNINVDLTHPIIKKWSAISRRVSKLVGARHPLPELPEFAMIDVVHRNSPGNVAKFETVILITVPDPACRHWKGLEASILKICTKYGLNKSNIRPMLVARLGPWHGEVRDLDDTCI
jgi:hypothetical protein